jgi:hypothetical protein
MHPATQSKHLRETFSNEVVPGQDKNSDKIDWTLQAMINSNKSYRAYMQTIPAALHAPPWGGKIE